MTCHHGPRALIWGLGVWDRSDQAQVMMCCCSRVIMATLQGEMPQRVHHPWAAEAQHTMWHVSLFLHRLTLLPRGPWHYEIWEYCQVLAKCELKYNKISECMAEGPDKCDVLVGCQGLLPLAETSWCLSAQRLGLLLLDNLRMDRHAGPG